MSVTAYLLLKEIADLDYLPPPSYSDKMPFPPDSVWPVNPPRRELFCDESAMCHPLVSPIAVMDWKGSPPVFICCGEELLEDEDKVVAQRLAREGVATVCEQYEGMPHVFGLMLGNAGAEMCMNE
jgi:hypothetical protein